MMVTFSGLPIGHYLRRDPLPVLDLRPRDTGEQGDPAVESDDGKARALRDRTTESEALTTESEAKHLK